MTPPAALSPLPAAPSVRSTPAAADTSRSDAAPSPFDQQLQAARNTPPADATPPVDRSSTPAPDARAQGGSSAADAAAKSQPGSNMSTPGASAAGATSDARGKVDATPLDAVPAMAQAVSIATAAEDAASPATSKTATASKPDETAAATLAGSMLALLGRVMDGMTGASSGAGDAAVSADGSASGQGKAAAVLSQGQGADDKTLAAAAAAGTPAANLASMPAGMERLLASTSTDTRKDHGLEALALTAAPAATPTTQAPALPQLQLSSPPGSSGFADELGQQVVWLGQQDIQQAKIHLHPQDLGSLDVHLSVSHDRVDVVFSAQHPAAVTAVQQSLPQLDHMLSQHGLSLGHAEVGQQQNGGDQRGRGEGRAVAAVDEIGEAGSASTPVAANRVGLLDAFA